MSENDLQRSGSSRGDYTARVDGRTRAMQRRQRIVAAMNIQKEADARVEQIQTQLTAERAARVYGDVQEGRDRIAADNALSDRIDAEAQSRLNGDAALAQSVANNATTMQGAITSAVNAEAAARIYADGEEARARVALESRVKAIEDLPRVKKYAASIGNGVLMSIAVAHNLGTTDVMVQVFTSTGIIVPLGVTRATNSVTLTFAVALAANSRVVVIG